MTKKGLNRRDRHTTLVQIIVGGITTIGVLVAGSCTSEGTITASEKSVRGTLRIADAARQEKAYTDFITYEKRYIYACAQITDTLMSFAIDPSPSTLLKAKTSLSESIASWSEYSAELVRVHQVVRLVDQSDLDERRAALELNEDYIADYVRELGDPSDIASLRMPTNPDTVSLFAFSVERHSNMLTDFTDSASKAIQLSE